MGKYRDQGAARLDALLLALDQVGAKAYPPLFATAGLHDSQVAYFEPVKWVAKLRALKTNENPLLLLTEMDAGHSGDSGRLGDLERQTRIAAWLLELARQRRS